MYMCICSHKYIKQYDEFTFVCIYVISGILSSREAFFPFYLFVLNFLFINLCVFHITHLNPIHSLVSLYLTSALVTSAPKLK